MMHSPAAHIGGENPIKMNIERQQREYLFQGVGFQHPLKLGSWPRATTTACTPRSQTGYRVR